MNICYDQPQKELDFGGIWPWPWDLFSYTVLR